MASPLDLNTGATGGGMNPNGGGGGGGGIVGQGINALSGFFPFGKKKGNDEPTGPQPYVPREQYFKVDPSGMLGNMWQQGARTAPRREAATFQMTPEQQRAMMDQQAMRQKQLQYLSQLQAQAAGTGGPSAAERMIEAQRGKNISQAMALAASARGLTPGAAARQAQQQAGAAGLDAVRQASIMRAQEQAQAQQMLGGALAGAREQDIGMAQLGQQAGLANLQSEQGQRQLNDQMTQYYMGMGMSLEEARLQAQMEIERLRAEQQIAINQALVAQQEGSANRSASMWGGALTGLGTLGVAALASDKNLKTNIKSDAKIGDFIDELKSYTYDYKDETFGKGKQHGIMAQDLEKSELGKTLVIETPYGKAINTTRAVGPILSALAQLNKKQKQLEKILEKK